MFSRQLKDFALTKHVIMLLLESAMKIMTQLKESNIKLAVDNDAPMRLAKVAAQFGLTAAALRTNPSAGALCFGCVAGKDWTSVAEVQRMFGPCLSG